MLLLNVLTTLLKCNRLREYIKNLHKTKFFNYFKTHKSHTFYYLQKNKEPELKVKPPLMQWITQNRFLKL